MKQLILTLLLAAGIGLAFVTYGFTGPNPPCMHDDVPSSQNP
jgi:hypothetical protein